MAEVLYSSKVVYDSPEAYKDFDEIQVVEYANGAHHSYGVSAEGRRKHLPNILSVYGMNGPQTKKEHEIFLEDDVAWRTSRQQSYLGDRGLPHYEPVPYKEPTFAEPPLEPEPTSLDPAGENEQQRRRQILDLTKERDDARRQLQIANDQIALHGEELAQQQTDHEAQLTELEESHRIDLRDQAALRQMELTAANQRAELAERLLAGGRAGRMDFTPAESRVGRVWDSTTGWVGWNLMGRPATHILTRIVPDGEGDVEVREYASEDRRFGTGVLLGALAVGATALVTLALTRHGHDTSVLNQTIINHDNADKARHIAEMKAIAGQEHLEKVRHLGEMKAIAGQEHLDKLRHQAEMRKLNTIQIQMHKYGNHILHHLKILNRSEAHEGLSHIGSHGEAGALKGQNAELSYSGDTVWHEVGARLREKLGYSPSTEKVRKATAFVLRLNHLRWIGGGYGVDSHRLPVGFRIRIPQNIVEIANK